ncbi:NADPH oxidase organizer 1-like [Gymnodraco acuticeps]|uniref:NADPH oxidase organizer 1-like n=1 Tax=Gymnodraco acuticeps TaxID=8218 RepID=A0A6P8UFE0_GYMAC|nr:NADPH oxidase organizer 1-like [Gymnodraco acuticeps]
MEDQRYPISVRLIGVMHKEKTKMYMTSVLWSDQSDILVYRTNPEFKKMHKLMKKAFPPASKMKQSDRIIPRYRDRRLRRGSREKGPTRSLLRLKFLQKYCNALLSCDPRVCQSADLIQFFHPKDQDLQPEFAQNSIMIMPADDEMIRDAGQDQCVGNVTQPFVTETYRCMAPYETKDTKNKPFKVALDEKVDVLIKDKAGWWLVENESKKMAWFPAPYLDKLEDDDEAEDEDEIDGNSERGMLYNAVKNYKATKDDEITVDIGAVVEVLQKSDNGWWFVRYNGKAGYIPIMYLKPYKHPHIRMIATNQDRRNSSPNQLMPSLDQQSKGLSLSQGNLLQLPARSSTPKMQLPLLQQKSKSVDIQPYHPPAAPSAASITSSTDVDTSPTTAKPFPFPKIMVEMDGEDEPRPLSLQADSEGSLSDSSSFSDDLNSSWKSSSSINLSQSYNEQELRLSRTPPPVVSNRLSPTSGLEGKMPPSVSDPNLYKGPTTPKVPPRPRAQEILTRCTTVTRKNAARRGLSPTQTDIFSR